MSLAHETDGIETDPRSWPSWTDEWSWVPSLPYDEDEGGGEYEAWLDRMALENAAIDHLERSMIPVDAVDALLHFGSDPEWCICTACVMYRTSRFLD